uniref:hypothetical protein n=1 Tax=Synechococcus sp. UW106 TaxID=368495 RepID=UPI0014828D21|nr:hypothetical protein [Synechococcus sp. UW106]
MDVSFWMIVGFLLAAYSVVANDSLQTLGTYISSNKKRTPKPVQMLFICTVTTVVLMLGWALSNGDPAWGRLSVPGREFPLPEPFSWVYVLPPLAVLALTQWGEPVSTSFLVLSSFQPANIGILISSSLTGYVLAFSVGLAAYGLGMWLLERWVFRCSEEGKVPSKVWYLLQWCSTGFLWSMWLVQDLANIFVFLPRQLGFFPMLISTLVLCVGLCVLVATGGGPIQAVLRSKTNTSDLRSATVIDFFFGLCLLYKAFLSTFPLSTTWVFLGLLGGREIALRIKEREFEYVFTNQESGTLAKIIGSDLWKAAIGVVVSLVIALSIQPLAQFTAG